MSVLRFFVSVLLLLLSSSAWANSNVSDANNAPLILASFIEDEQRPILRRPKPQGKEEARSSWALFIDNDLFALSGRDRDYTGGLSFTLAGTTAATHAFSVDSGLGQLNRLFSIAPDSRDIRHSFKVGLTAFTPEQTELSTPQLDDRPYASLIYIANSRQYLNHRERRSVITTLTVGALGLKIGSALQNGIHSIVGSDKAQGWDNQISDGGELTFRYSVAHQKTAWARYRGGMNNIEIKRAVRGSVGYLTGATAGISARWGRINSPWWSFNPQLSDYAEKSAPQAATVNGKQHASEFYFWAGSNLHLRAYNAFLQGQLRDSAITYSSGELEHLLLESWLGVTKVFGSGYRVSYLIRNQTSELKQGNGDRAITWGGLIIGKQF